MAGIQDYLGSLVLEVRVIPQYLLERVGGLPAGQRSEKRPKIYWPQQHNEVRVVGYSPLGSWRKPDIDKRTECERKDELVFQELSFDNTEYRFFGVEFIRDVVGEQVAATCRGCGTYMASPLARRNHITSCGQKLLRAYRILLDKKKCFGCGKEGVRQEKFGVPFCKDPQCFLDFKFSVPISKTLENALLDIEAQDLAIKEGV